VALAWQSLEHIWQLPKERGLQSAGVSVSEGSLGIFPSASAPLTFLRDKSRAPSRNRSRRSRAWTPLQVRIGE